MKKHRARKPFGDEYWGDSENWMVDQLEEDLDSDAIDPREYGFSHGYYGEV